MDGVEAVPAAVAAAVSASVLGALERLAEDLRARGTEVDRWADEVVEAVHRTDWSGRAAEAAAARSRERGTALRDAADEHRRAAAAVESHARAVAAAAAVGGAVLGAAAGVAERVVDGLVDGAEALVHRGSP